MILEAIRELMYPGHWKPTLYNIRHGNWWPNAFLNALPSCCFNELKMFRGDWDSYWS